MKRVYLIGIAASSAALLAVGGLAGSSMAGGSHAEGNFAPQDVSGLAVPASSTNVFVPIASCRIANTAARGGKIRANKYRSFIVRGTSGFPAQGGKSGGCGIPASAVAVAASLTASRETGSGTLTAYAFGAGAPKTTMLSYRKGVNITSGATARLASFGVTPHLRVVNRSASTHLVIDVTGYYVPQIHAVIAPAGGIYGGSTRVLDSVRTAAGSYRVRIDRDLAGCTVTASVYGGPYYASAFVSGSYIHGETYAVSGGAPVKVDLYWSLAVTC